MTCSTCKRRKPAEAFGRDASQPLGLAYRCKECERVRDRAKNRERQRRYRQRYPGKVAATSALNHALREGRVIRPERCEACGLEPEPRSDGRAGIQAHHDDYSKPLEVGWLCGACHRAEHEVAA